MGFSDQCVAERHLWEALVNRLRRVMINRQQDSDWSSTKPAQLFDDRDEWCVRVAMVVSIDQQHFRRLTSIRGAGSHRHVVDAAVQFVECTERA